MYISTGEQWKEREFYHLLSIRERNSVAALYSFDKLREFGKRSVFKNKQIQTRSSNIFYLKGWDFMKKRIFAHQIPVEHLLHIVAWLCLLILLAGMQSILLAEETNFIHSVNVPGMPISFETAITTFSEYNSRSIQYEQDIQWVKQTFGTCYERANEWPDTANIICMV